MMQCNVVFITFILHLMAYSAKAFYLENPSNITDEVHPFIESLDTSLTGYHAPSNRIVGGHTNYKDGSFPYLATLVVKDKEKFKVRCEGSLIRTQWILTAAHCYVKGQDEVGDIRILLGIQCLSEFLEGSQRFQIENIVQHPYYIKGSFENDIALIKLKLKKDDKPPNFIPICLPEDNIQQYNDVEVKISGFGKVAGGGIPDCLQYAEIKTTNYAWCQDVLKLFKSEITDNSICAMKVEFRVGSCYGDSGGPLVTKGNEKEKVKENILIGVVTGNIPGIDCASPYVPTIYARVSKHLDWINEVAGQSPDSCKTN